MLTHAPIESEFKVGQILTLDRYNHKDDTVTARLVGFDRTHSGTLLYCFADVEASVGCNHFDVFCKTTGKSIVDSIYFEPVPDDERHEKICKEESLEESRK